MPIAPTLILGLGGTGSKIVQHVAEKVSESSSSQSERIAFVVFDTDVNDLGRIRHANPGIHTVQTSTRNTVGEYLTINTNARDNWFPVNEMLNRKTLTEGAAQVRAISRLAFDTTLKGGNLDGLHRAIEQLFRIDKDQEEQALRVIITSSLAGGTGSGLILSVAMYLANYLRTKYPKAKAITRGFFVQPDVFYSVIKATEEQQNLQVNAYATVRELDAFLMKGDNTLPPQYRDLAFEFPRVGADGVEAISAMPYDFCFLFDAKNSSGGSLDSFATYLDHAATCIYTQSIGPMSKKSNSREDNVLREVIKNDGRNRYAGAGASRLVYPWAHVRDVVGLRWADLALSEQWLQFDDQYRDRLDALAKQREQGYAAHDLDIAVEFIGAIDQNAANKAPFARAVQSQCLAYDEDGISVVGNRWQEYLSALRHHVLANAVVASQEALKRNATARVSALADSADGDDYVSAYYELKKYHDIVERDTEEKAGLIGYTLFQADRPGITRQRDSHQLETYLREKVTGKFVHPVSARYFLYKTLKELQAQKQQVETQLANTQQFFSNFERNAFDDQGTEEVETVEDLANRKRSMMERMRNKPGSALQELTDQFQNYTRKVGELRDQTVYAKVLEEAIAYTSGMSTSFETFFEALKGNLKRLKTTVDMQRTKYDDLKGSTTRYVLASSECLDSVYESMPYTGGVMSVDSELSESIYSKVRDFHMLADGKDGNFFQDLYQDTMLGYFSEQVMQRYESQISIDVIEALEREYRITTKNYEADNVAHYLRGEIDKAKRLAAPFLEQPLGEERHPIEACAYNPKLEGDSDPKRRSLISELLGDYGGEKDEEISPQEILFYSAIYGIRARDLSKYSPARVHATQNRPAGQYFSAYYNLISEIEPSVEATKVITPHIDRRWHWISQLPDLDEGNQAVQLRVVHDALLLGLVHQRIVWTTVHTDHRVYQYRSDSPIDKDFIVSNGTPCDHFHEVIDALTINPVAVRQITQSIERRMRTLMEEARTISFAQTPFARELQKGIPLPELEVIVPALKGARFTIFDVAAFYGMTVPKDIYSDIQLHDMVADFLAHVRKEVDAVESNGDALPAIEALLLDQFTTFEMNIPALLDSDGLPFARKLRHILRPLSDLLDELHLRETVERVEQLVQRLSNG
ncbi:tubulin-like doman-containing protein [Microbacterium terregens]|uniref:Tubulin-like doman-containing protein n=1 Tax=Microbacterium terregens TaxID=69363 RepID=A0ABV5T4P6_9MICO